jgi:hypothetical protein
LPNKYLRPNATMLLRVAFNARQKMTGQDFMVKTLLTSST